ncbi:hypothetical protein Anas_03690 [Armadillidium nasatum]|uniref:Uncharacterized protein n=1 Tax=Armadillidium nasatum TaxID=96803 RepID=A0A5N5SRH1_9CRUS|nr:hypothetical protein Anas_03690 [Armadillidium nasatum]
MLGAKIAKLKCELKILSLFFFLSSVVFQSGYAEPSQQNCALNCTNVSCPKLTCGNSGYKVPGICCEECL